MKMTAYEYRGVNTRVLQAIIAKLEKLLAEGQNLIALKNGAEIEVYGSVDDALLVDPEDREMEFADKYELAYAIYKIGRSSEWF